MEFSDQKTYEGMILKRLQKTRVWPIGDYYVGECENDVMHGPGLYCHGKQKLIYERNFKNDQREG